MSLHCITICSLITALTNILTNSDIHFDNIVENIDDQVPLWSELEFVTPGGSVKILPAV